MGTGWCAEERDKGKARPSSHRHIEGQAVFERTRKPPSTPGTPDPVAKSKVDLYLEPSPEKQEELGKIVDFFPCSWERFRAGWRRELMASQQAATHQPGEARLPFLITSFADKGNFIMICSKGFQTLYQDPSQREKKPEHNPELVLEKCVQKRFVPKSLEESVFFLDLSHFIT